MPEPPVRIRPERARDHDAIFALTRAAFATAAFSDGSEPAIIARLRAEGDLALSLVAARNGGIVGHIAFSPARVGAMAGDWFALGPVSVAPSCQRQGIGTRLIRAGLVRLRAGGARGCVLIGDPAFYRRFGFASGTLSWRAVPRAYIHGLAFAGPPPRGEIAFRPAFDSPAPDP